MALPVTSGTASFLVSRDDIIQAALRSLKVIGVGETPGTEDYTNCAFALNTLLKELNTEGKMAWLFQTVVFPFQANKGSYTIAETGADVANTRPVSILHVFRRDSNSIDTPMTKMTRQEYDQLPNKSQTGTPVNWMYDDQIGLATVYFWLVPQDTTYSCGLVIQRPIQDILSSGQNFDVSQEWFSTLRWILADEVSSEYEVDLQTQQMVRSRAETKRAKLADFSQEEGSVFFMPDPQGGFRGGLPT